MSFSTNLHIEETFLLSVEHDRLRFAETSVCHVSSASNPDQLIRELYNVRYDFTTKKGHKRQLFISFSKNIDSSIAIISASHSHQKSYEIINELSTIAFALQKHIQFKHKHCDSKFDPTFADAVVGY